MTTSIYPSSKTSPESGMQCAAIFIENIPDRVHDTGDTVFLMPLPLGSREIHGHAVALLIAVAHVLPLAHGRLRYVRQVVARVFEATAQARTEAAREAVEMQRKRPLTT